MDPTTMQSDESENWHFLATHLPHTCPVKPAAIAYGTGTTIACKECKAIFELKHDQRDGRHWAKTGSEYEDL